MELFKDMRKKGFKECWALVVALFLLLLLYLKPYRWESIQLALTAYEPAPELISVNMSISGGDLRQRMQHFIETSQQRMLQGAKPDNLKCPDWYNVIRDDLKPWSDRQGITPTALANAWPLAHFRFQIVDGELYIERNWQVMEFKYMEYLRFYFSVWGILQLLRRYPGQVPDVDVMMETFDHPRVDKYQWEANLDPPPLLKYCSTPNHWDITWPDWSFWGWAELAIPPWQLQLDAIVQTNKTDWEKRPGHAFWQGGSETCLARQELWKCEDNDRLRWGIELRHVDWTSSGDSMDHKLLENQCQHKFKLYMEGWAWSASAKYIMACDATTLMVESEWFEFWYRGLKAGVNFLPVSKTPNLCANIRRAVDWARAHPKNAKAIGQAGTEFMTQEVNMPLVYDYMLHVLREYASLQTFKVQPSEYALKVDAKSWLTNAFDERNLDAPLPVGFREWGEPRGGISPERVRAQMLAEEASEHPPCVIDWESPAKPALDPRDTVGSIPVGLRREFEEMVRLEREREELEAREKEAWAARGRVEIIDPGDGVGDVRGEREGLVGREASPEVGVGEERGVELLGGKILGELGGENVKAGTDSIVGEVGLVTAPLETEDLKGTEDVRWKEVGGVDTGGVDAGVREQPPQRVAAHTGVAAKVEP